jgi:hypothetical protein
MATKEELAASLSKEQLASLAEESGLQLEGNETKDELIEAVANSRKISKEDLETEATAVGANPDDTDDEDEEDVQEETADTGSLDPMLVDPDKVARERVKGTTSDASQRVEGATAADTPADPGELAKASDAGAEAYPFPAQGDVDVATVDPAEGAEEFMAPLEVEDWVVLGEHELVPERLVGRRAVVLEAPRDLVPVDEADDTEIKVRTRDEVNATLVIPLSAVAEVQKRGYAPTVRG